MYSFTAYAVPWLKSLGAGGISREPPGRVMGSNSEKNKKTPLGGPRGD